MIDPYRMVVINLIASSLLVIGILFYKFVYPKKNINLIVLLILLSLLPLISILRKGTYESGDLSIHSMFAMSFYDSLKDGNIIPRWAGEINYGFGYPLFLFLYPFPYYIISLFHSLGFSFISGIKLLLIASFISSGVFMYLWMQEKLGKQSALVASLLYLYSPYHLVDMHFRVAIGEMLAFALLPLCFLSCDKLIKNYSLKWFLFLTFSLFLLILSHQAISLISFFFIGVYLLIAWVSKKGRKIQTLSHYYMPLLIAILLSAFYWAPLIIEARYTHLFNYSEIVFPTLSQFIYSPWRGGFLFQGPKGELSFIIGYVQWIIVFMSIFLIAKNKSFLRLQDKKILIFFLISFTIVFILMQSITKYVWELIFILKNFQFSYRLLLLTSFFSAVLGGIATKTINKKWFVIVICIMTVAPTILNWGNRKTLTYMDDKYIKNELPYVMGRDWSLDPGSPIWLDSKKFKIDRLSKNHIEIVAGQASIVELQRNSVKHGYLIKTFVNTTFRENTLYFPGWKLKINNKEHPIDYVNPRFPGIISFSLAKGEHKIELVFANTPIRIFSAIISFLSISGIILYVGLHKKLRNNA